MARGEVGTGLEASRLTRLVCEVAVAVQSPEATVSMTRAECSVLCLKNE